jgi:hypothetical protein
VFQFGQPGFELYQQTTGVGVLLKINNNIFVHGELSQGRNTRLRDIIDYNESLQRIRPPYEWIHDVDFQADTRDMLIGLLQGRSYGFPQGLQGGGANIPRRLGNEAAEQLFCQAVQSDIDYFCENECGHHPSQNIRIFKGHCQQNTVFNLADTRHSLGTVVSQTDMLDILSNESMVHGTHNVEHANRSFGITTECELAPAQRHGAHAFQPQIIKVDVAMGRGQMENEQIYTERSIRRGMSEKTFFYSKTPQVVEIIGDRLHIRRSSLANMVRHLPRPTYQARVRYLYDKLAPLARLFLQSGLINLQRPQDRSDAADEIEDIIDSQSAVFNDLFYKMVLLEWKELLEARPYNDALVRQTLQKWLTPSIYGGNRRSRRRMCKHSKQRTKPKK